MQQAWINLYSKLWMTKRWSTQDRDAYPNSLNLNMDTLTGFYELVLWSKFEYHELQKEDKIKWYLENEMFAKTKQALG